MTSYTITFPSGTTVYYPDAGINDLQETAASDCTIIITDETVAALYGDRFRDYRMIIIPAGEQAKSWQTIEQITQELIAHQAHRQTLLLGIGGGVVTDITGFIASIYMRGVPFAFVPTTLLGMVDAAIGGKNGINTGLHKNMLGTISQPAFILYHTGFLLSLPDEQWSNGFAEIIKYGYIADKGILNLLHQKDIGFFQRHPRQLSELIAGCVNIKNKIVLADEHENGLRKLLNFGHTAGHAFETLYQLPHGYAVALGMKVALKLSEQQVHLPSSTGVLFLQLLEKYKLPVHLDCDIQKVLEVLQMDKKRKAAGIDYVLIRQPGIATIKELGLPEIEAALTAF